MNSMTPKQGSTEWYKQAAKELNGFIFESKVFRKEKMVMASFAFLRLLADYCNDYPPAIAFYKSLYSNNRKFMRVGGVQIEIHQGNFEKDDLFTPFCVKVNKSESLLLAKE